eukprot:1427549-Rhodomonas_salina.1
MWCDQVKRETEDALGLPEEVAMVAIHTVKRVFWPKKWFVSDQVRCEIKHASAVGVCRQAFSAVCGADLADSTLTPFTLRIPFRSSLSSQRDQSL